MTSPPNNRMTRDITVNGGRLRAEVAGAGDDLLLVHSGITDAGMWDDQFAAFAEHFRVARYDLRAFGESSAVDGPFSHVDDLLAVVDQLNLTSPRVVAASMGARVAIDAALRDPAAFDRLLLVGPAVSGLGFEDEALRACWREMSDAWDAGEIERAIDIETRFWISGPTRPGSADEAVIARVNQMQQRIVELMPDDEEDPELEEEIAAVDRLAELTVPILVVVGEHDVSDIHRNARAIANGAANAHITTLAGTGHLPNMEAVADFNRLALEFLLAT